VLGVDLDEKVLAWAQNKIDKELTKDQCSRVSLVKQDVMHVDADPVECILAMNFSYYGLKDRNTLKEYFTAVHGDLLDDGVFLLDAYGGSDSFVEMDEERNLDGFTYIWDQHHVNPISGDVVNYIHFEFPNGSKLRRAFTYEWRIWTLPEIRDVLVDAGFSSVKVYWEGTDEDGGGNGVWAIDERGEACAGWVAYIAALK
jgi:cyclopropane fatty-acyl-phospholipid synthase-like methyltransferase